MPELEPTTTSEVDGAAVLAKASRRLVPFLFLLYVVNYLDRANISFTRRPMEIDLHLSDRQYGFAAGIFFLGYTLLEVPSNLALQKIGARRWIARIIFSWGIVAAAMALVRGPASFSSVRAILGAAEAGFMPGMILYLSRWFPSRQRGKAFGLFLTSTALSGVIGSPLSAAILKMDGFLHLHGWQWVFLLEGLACLPLGILTLRWLPDRPHDAKWLSASEADWLENELREDSAEAPHEVHELLGAMADSRVWVLSALYFLLISGLFGFIFWAPAVIVDGSGGWITAAPYAIGAIAMVFIGRHSDHRNERRWHVAACALLGAAGMAGAALSPRTPFSFVSLCVAAIGIWGCLGPFWALPTSFLRGRGAAAGIATVNSIGCTAGFVTPYVIGVIKQNTNGFGGLYFVAILLAAGGALVLLMPESKKAPRGFPIDGPAQGAA